MDTVQNAHHTLKRSWQYVNV